MKVTSSSHTVSTESASLSFQIYLRLVPSTIRPTWHIIARSHDWRAQSTISHTVRHSLPPGRILAVGLPSRGLLLLYHRSCQITMRIEGCVTHVILLQISHSSVPHRFSTVVWYKLPYQGKYLLLDDVQRLECCSDQEWASTTDNQIKVFVCLYLNLLIAYRRTWSA